MATTRRKDSDSWQTRFMLDGRRYAKDTDTKKAGQEWEAQIRAQVAQGKAPDLRKDNRRLQELAEAWYSVHGYTLKDGKKRLGKLRHICKLLGNPIARNFRGSDFTQYRVARLEAGLSENNCNHELTYLKAVFNELIRLEDWVGENALKNVRPLKFDERELSYLTREQIDTLLQACADSRSAHLLVVVKLCLATGARWNEANQLRREQIQVFDERALVSFSGTKSGKVRQIPISVELATECLAAGHTAGRLYVDCMSQFRRALERTDIELPEGQATHVLRHTFASHYMMNGGDILALQKILGHATLTMTLRYAHLAPDHLQTAVNLNPLNRITTKLPQADKVTPFRQKSQA